MASPSAELPLATWAPSTSPLRIEYSKPAMEEIRARAVEGYYRLAKGGVELAGLLIGNQTGDTIRILSQQPFDIEYAFGPTFLMSPRDQVFLRKLVEDLSTGLAADGLKVLGLYISHPRGELCLSEADLVLFNDLFPHSWQTVLVLKPSRLPETPAAFFVREPNGQIRTNRSHQEFALAPEMGERRPRGERTARRGETSLPADESLRALASAATRQPDTGKPITAEGVTPVATPHHDGASAPPVPVLPTLHPSSSPLAQARAQIAQSQAQFADAAALPPSPTSAPSLPSGSAPPPLAHARVASTAQGHGPDTASAALMPPRSPEPSATVAWEDEQPRSPRASSPLRFAIPAVALVLVTVLGYLIYLAFTSAPPRVEFYTREVGGRVEVVWQLSGIRDATSATITIDSNGQRKSIDLIRTGQLTGTFTDPLLTRDAAVFLDIQRSSAPSISRKAPFIRGDSAASSLAELPLGSASTPLAEEPTATVVEDAVAASADPVGNGASESAVPEIPADLPRAEEPLLPAPVDPALAMPAGGGSTPTSSAAASSTVGASTRASTPPPSAASNELGQAARTLPPPPSQPVARTPESAPASAPAPLAESPVRAQNLPPAAGLPAQAGQSGPVQPLPQKPSIPRPAVETPRPVPPVQAAKPAQAPRARAGRLIWTGQLRKNQILQMNGADANQGAVNGSLPGQPVQLSVLPGELTPQGLIVYTANPRYRNEANATEEPGPTNGWNRTRYRYDPLRANSVIVTATPNSTNRWQGLTVRNDEKTVNVIVIDWLVPNED